MVSKQDFSTSLALRGPSSLVSRHTRSHSNSNSNSHSRSQSRSKRYNRSHAGGASHVPQNEFPLFSNSGDVEILVRAGGHENRYLLHRHTLTRCSGFFEASTSLQWSRAGRADSAGPVAPSIEYGIWMMIRSGVMPLKGALIRDWDPLGLV